jgi:hypothetical protein
MAVDSAFIVEAVVCAVLAVVVGALNLLSIHRARNPSPHNALSSPAPDRGVLVLIKPSAPSANSPLSPLQETPVVGAVIASNPPVRLSCSFEIRYHLTFGSALLCDV